MKPFYKEVEKKEGRRGIEVYVKNPATRGVIHKVNISLMKENTMLTSFNVSWNIVMVFMSNALIALNFFLRQNMDQFIWTTCKEESANFPLIQTKVSCSLNLCWMAVMASKLSKELHGKVHKYLHLYVHSLGNAFTLYCFLLRILSF